MKREHSNAIFHKILGDIVDLNIMPGDKISENKMCQEFNVSRTIVRSAFQNLEEMGFLDVVAKSGTFVSKINMDYIKSALLIRLSLEKEVATRVLRDENKRISLVEKLNKILKEQEKFVQDSNYIKDFANWDTIFHETILNCYEYSMLPTMISEQIHHINRWRNITVLSGIPMYVLLEEHKNIIKALENRDIFLLISSMDIHINKILYSNEKLDKEFIEYFI